MYEVWQRSGYNYCEEDYAVTPRVVEFWNTVSYFSSIICAFLISDRMRSMGKGNVFTGVCVFTGRREVWYRGGLVLRRGVV